MGLLSSCAFRERGLTVDERPILLELTGRRLTLIRL
jgi:hypothetical protein